MKQIKTILIYIALALSMLFVTGFPVEAGGCFTDAVLQQEYQRQMEAKEAKKKKEREEFEAYFKVYMEQLKANDDGTGTITYVE